MMGLVSGEEEKGDPVDLKKFVRDVPDFPAKGISFKDVTPLLRDEEAFKYIIDELAQHYEKKKIDVILGAEARGFIMGGALAYRLGVGFIPARRPGRLPREVARAEYELEYGTDALEMHTDAIKKGNRVLIVDDVLATGNTALAKIGLVEQLSGKVVGLAFLLELTFLSGRDQIKKYDVFSLIQY